MSANPMFDGHGGDVLDYCRGLAGADDLAASAAQSAFAAAQSVLADPMRLRALLLGLARREALTMVSGRAAQPGQSCSAPPASGREILELVRRHGIQPEHLGAVLGVSADEAYAALAAEDHELSRPEEFAGSRRVDEAHGEVDPGNLSDVFDRDAGHAFDYCLGLVGREDVAARAAASAVTSAQALLDDPGLIRAWLFSLARRQAQAMESSDPAGPSWATCGRREILDLVGRYGIPAEHLGTVLGVPADEASTMLAAAEHELASSTDARGSESRLALPGRRLQIAAAAAISVAAIVAGVVYLRLIYPIMLQSSDVATPSAHATVTFREIGLHDGAARSIWGRAPSNTRSGACGWLLPRGSHAR